MCFLAKGRKCFSSLRRLSFCASISFFVLLLGGKLNGCRPLLSAPSQRHWNLQLLLSISLFRSFSRIVFDTPAMPRFSALQLLARRLFHSRFRIVDLWCRLCAVQLPQPPSSDGTHVKFSPRRRFCVLLFDSLARITQGTRPRGKH